MRGLKRRLKRFFSALFYRIMLVGLPSGRGNQDESKIAVVCTAALGDFVVFCDVARSLCRQGKQLTLVCHQESGIREFAKITGYFNEVITVPHGFSQRYANLRRLKTLKAGTVLVAPAERHILSDIYALAIQADRRILPDTMQGCSLPALKRLVDSRADQLIPVTAKNEQQRYEQYLSGCGLYRGTVRPFVFEEKVYESQPNVPYIVVFPGAGSPAKMWPVGRFAHVVDMLRVERRYNILVCGTETERELGKKLCNLLGVGADNLCGKTSLEQLLPLLTRCSLVLANDSGSAHLAIACGAPTAIICGSWEYGRFYPNDRLLDHCRVIIAPEGTLKCSPCGESRPGCTKDRAAPCVLAVREDEVFRGAQACMKE